MPYQPSPRDDSASLLQVLSHHLLQQEIVKKSIEPFSGSAIDFWPWAGKIQSHVKELNLTPLQHLLLLETYTSKEPQVMISNRLASTGEVTTLVVQEVWDALVQGYGSSHKISEQLIQKLDQFPTIKGPNQGDSLQSFHDLC